MVSKKKLLDKLIVQLPPEQSPSYEFDKLREENYAMNMYQLQKKASLTFKEAEAFLELYYDYWVARKNNTMFGDYDPDAPSDRSRYNLRRRAKKKIADSGYTIEEIFKEYFPIKEYAPLYL